jgi:hypothetical protein
MIKDLSMVQLNEDKETIGLSGHGFYRLSIIKIWKGREIVNYIWLGSS